MHTQTLNGNWIFRQRGTEHWLHARVPGGVHTDLLAAGRIPDPFYGVNEEQVQWVAEKDWEYRRYFYPSPSLLAQQRIFLVCAGLDTLADVRLNDVILGVVNNMHHSWQWEVKSLLKEGENRLDIVFRSPLVYTRQRQRANPMGDLNMGIRGGPHLRKTPSHFGWDWGPRLPNIGIWKDIHLDGAGGARLLDVRFDQKHENGIVMLTARMQCELDGVQDIPRTLRVRANAPDRQVWQVDAPARPQQSIPVVITNPQIWWPNGMGEPALYQVEVELLEEDRVSEQTHVLDRRSFQIGLRTIELRQAQDAAGTSFTFVVNGQPVFCKGSNWIPADSFPTRVTPQQVEQLLHSAAVSHQNMLRVWGGGYYESDAFYDLCDRYGILVWQDFLFACATYPLDDPAYLDSLRCEVIENVRRLRHHACLALWCGNNEIEWEYLTNGWRKKMPANAEAYRRFFFEQLPEIVAAEDPYHPYWPSSPSSNDPFNEPNGEKQGDAHLWEVYHMYRPPQDYREQNPRFVSEFGFQSLPDLDTVAAFAPPESWHLDSKEMMLHQRALAGNPKLRWYLSQRFRIPHQFEDLLYLSQVYQAEAVRIGVEHWRRHPERTSGALYWQLNDCWPVISWASIDYYGRWKALQYAARRFFAPVQLSIEEETGKGQHQAAVWLTNDTQAPWQGRLRWTLETLDGEVLEGGEQAIQAAPSSASCLQRQDFTHPKSKIDWRNSFFVAELWQGEERLDIQVVAFTPEKGMRLKDPGLRAEMSQQGSHLTIHLAAQKLARFIELRLKGANVVFTDNFFDLPAGRSVEIECPLPDGWTLEQAQAALQVRSLGQITSSESPWLSGLKGGWIPAESLVQGIVWLFRR
jgi:beta-mannosidase